MITVDTSALVEIALGARRSADCARALAVENDVKVSAATIAEAMIVAGGRKIVEEMTALIGSLTLDVLPVTADSARRAAEAYWRWGRGFHPAALNFGDCFAYETAAAHGGRLLFLGNDFAKTDLRGVL